MKNKNKVLLAISLSISLLSSVSATAKNSLPCSDAGSKTTLINPYTKPTTFCDIGQFTGTKRQYTVKNWDESTQFDIQQGFRDGTTIEGQCKDVVLEPHTYCTKGFKSCWVEFDIMSEKEENQQ